MFRNVTRSLYALCKTYNASPSASSYTHIAGSSGSSHLSLLSDCAPQGRTVRRCGQHPRWRTVEAVSNWSDWHSSSPPCVTPTNRPASSGLPAFSLDRETTRRFTRLPLPSAACNLVRACSRPPAFRFIATASTRDINGPGSSQGSTKSKGIGFSPCRKVRRPNEEGQAVCCPQEERCGQARSYASGMFAYLQGFNSVLIQLPSN